MKKFPPYLNNVLTLPSKSENITFYTFIMHSLNITRYIKHGVKYKVHQVQRKQLTSQSMFKMSATGINTSPQTHLLCVNCVINLRLL